MALNGLNFSNIIWIFFIFQDVAEDGIQQDVEFLSQPFPAHFFQMKQPRRIVTIHLEKVIIFLLISKKETLITLYTKKIIEIESIQIFAAS